MPLGNDMSKNIEELMNTYKEKGKIGNITPKSKKKAMQISWAIGYRKKREG